jgi:hypothetical protein
MLQAGATGIDEEEEYEEASLKNSEDYSSLIFYIKFVLVCFTKQFMSACLYICRLRQTTSLGRG